MIDMSTIIASIIAAVATSYAAWLSYNTNKTTNAYKAEELAYNASDALRNDLLSLIEKYETREKQSMARESLLLDRITQFEERNYKLQEVVNSLRIDILQLREENQKLRDELIATRHELEFFKKRYE